MNPATTVLVIPGFAGSALDLPRPAIGAPPLRIWINYTELAISGLDDMQLDATGLNPGPLATRALAVNGFSIDGYYRPLIQTLGDVGYVTENRPYDWRISNRIHVGPLQSRMAALDAAGPWAVVAHSMGAMQALLAWSGLAQAGPVKNLKRFVWVDPAFGGSYGAAYCMAGGHFDELSWGFQVAVMQGVSGIVTRPNHFLYPLSLRLDAAVASWPALYELLPSTAAPWALLDRNAGLFYSKRNWDENQYFQQQWADFALATQALMASAYSGGLPPSVVVHSAPLTTLSATPTNIGGFARKEDYPATTAGDGTLLWSRSSLPGVHALTVGSTHPDACADPQFLSRVAGLIETGLVADTQLPPLPTPDPQIKTEVIPRSTVPGPWPFLAIAGDP
jgi:hypothetical protein